jgi:stage II sporulation protein AB (anti-sigma F factor)
MSLSASPALTQGRRIDQGHGRRGLPGTGAEADHASIVGDRAGLSQRHPSIPASIPAARTSVARFATEAGADADELGRIKLAASEALTNAVLYAYPDRIGEIQVDVWLADGELWLLVGDEGCGLNAGRHSSGLGQGLALVSQVSDGFSIVRRSSGGTELRLNFELGAMASGSARGVRQASGLDHRPARQRREPD